MSDPDVRIESDVPHASVYLFRPQNARAERWLLEHVQEDAQWFGGSLAVEWRYVADLVAGLQEEGFHVE